MDLSGHKLLVTGAQQGIGAAVALAGANAGADVALNYLDDEAATRVLADKIEALGRTAVLVQGDVSVIDSISDIVSTAAEALGGLDTLCNNAGVYPRQPFLELTEETWDTTLGINLKGTAFMSQAFARHVKATGAKNAAIVSMSSLACQGWENSAHYAASKGGINSLTKNMAIELAPLGIRVNAIAPGVIDTAQPRGGYTEEQLQTLVAGSLAGRLGAPSEVADVAVALLSSASSFVNGQTIHVNGGVFFA
ncbi:SDR family NAD(P)-dependent oxidoreductase [Poseidonocella sedimentorum]|uniref:Glucose 1-dehydrogenase n=1 Tax=Poseidonocella sedimentorum TaxID=871652 RepID=A0A1I6E3K3_9RHOB|nr:SDR family oxidoreductase [Poseidonocella sedimentorum]SFR12303.1 glucose 1-dehydrogenase [Poseidonocella sedimentorum]